VTAAEFWRIYGHPLERPMCAHVGCHGVSAPGNLYCIECLREMLDERELALIPKEPAA
jgi:hypothetical protein